MPRRSIWKGSFVDAFSSKMRSKRENLSSRKIRKFLFLFMLLFGLYLLNLSVDSTLFSLFLRKVSFVLFFRALSFLLHIFFGGSVFAAALLLCIR
uniref:Ribosomal protein S19 n=1 Tax=Pinus armandii TaxID=88733 RepID=A0A8H2SEF9_PINAR|nr:ribosomal protein S19 [Pinus armandii]